MIFALESENTGKQWSFTIDCTIAEFRDWEDTQEYRHEWNGRMYNANHYAELISEMENHGVLDVGGSDETELFHSYEIEEDMFPVILEQFREFFKKNGLPVS